MNKYLQIYLYLFCEENAADNISAIVDTIDVKYYFYYILYYYYYYYNNYYYYYYYYCYYYYCNYNYYIELNRNLLLRTFSG